MVTYIRNLLTLLAFALVPAAAVADNDFVALVMEHVEADAEQYPSSDYQQITVSPTMIQSVTEMMNQGAFDNTTEISADDREIMSKLLRNVKSMRIFIANANNDDYKSVVQQVVSENKHKYKAFKSAAARDIKSTTRIYTRKSAGKVVELVVVYIPDGQSTTDSHEGPNPDKLQILNMTGEFTADFINLLIQMRS